MFTTENLYIYGFGLMVVALGIFVEYRARKDGRVSKKTKKKKDQSST